MRRLAGGFRAALGALPSRELRLLALAAALSAALVIAYAIATSPPELRGDEVVYDEYGEFAAEGSWWHSTLPFDRAHPSAWKAPAYPGWVGVWYSVLGDSPFRLEVVQGLLLAPLTVLLTFLLARRLLGPRVAIASAFLVAAFPLVWEYFGLLFPEALAIPLTLALLLVVIDREPTTGRVVAAGLLLGANLLVRPTSFLLIAAIVAAYVLAVGWRAGIANTALAVVVAAVVVLPWTVRNYVVTDGGFIPISVQDAAAYGTFNSTSAGDPEDPYAWRAVPAVHREFLEEMKPVDDAEFRSRVTELAEVYVKDNPFSVARAFFWNGIVRLWDLRSPGAALEEADFQGRSRALRLIGLIAYWLLLPLAALGIWRLRARREIWVPLLATFALACVAFTVIGGTRYRAPLEPALVVLACSLLAEPWRRRARLEQDTDELDPVAPAAAPTREVPAG